MSLPIPHQTTPELGGFSIQAIKPLHEPAIAEARDFVSAMPLDDEAEHNGQLFELAAGTFPTSLRALRELAIVLTGHEVNTAMAGRYRMWGDRGHIQPPLMLPEEKAHYAGRIATFMLWQREPLILQHQRRAVMTTVFKQEGIWTVMLRDPGVDVIYGEPQGSGNVRDFAVFAQRAGGERV